MLHADFVRAFDRLLECRRRYDAIDRSASTVSRLALAREALDDARNAARRARITLHPEPDDVANGSTVMHCPEMDRLINVVPDHAGVLRCACGVAQVPGEPISR